MVVFTLSCLRLIRVHVNKFDSTLLKAIKSFDGIVEDREGQFEAIRLLILHSDLSDTELIVASELLIASVNESVDLDFSFLMTFAEHNNVSILKVLLLQLSKGANHKILNFTPTQAHSVLAEMPSNEIEWKELTIRYKLVNIDSHRRAIVCRRLTTDNVLTDEDLNAEVGVLNKIFAIEAISLDSENNWFDILPPVLPFEQNDWPLIDTCEEPLSLMWEPLNNPLIEKSLCSELLQSARSTRMSASELATIVQLLPRFPQLCLPIVSNPEQLQQMVDTNWAVAVELLVGFMSLHRAEDLHALDSLLISINLLEVVHSLSRRIDLPREFINKFISKAFGVCYQIVDPVQQKRIAASLSLFLKTQFQHSLEKVYNQLAEVESFCLTFSNVPECSGLFKMLKGMESS